MSTLSKEKLARTEPLFFRMAPEFRRCGIYLCVGYLLLAGTIIVLTRLELGAGWDHCAVTAAILGVPMLGGALLIFCQLLRVDDRGIWRRRLFFWDLWPWEAFTAGKVRQDFRKDSFVFPSNPWWNRNLTLELLQADDRAYLANRRN
jgi:hypothetical protein